MTFEKGKLFFDFEQRINFEVAHYFFENNDNENKKRKENQYV